MAASTWTWLGNTSAVNLSSNWSLTSGPGNNNHRPQGGDTGIFSGAGVAPQFVDTQLSGSTTLDLTGSGTVQFLNDTGFSNSTSLDPSTVINATGTATSILTEGRVINAGKIEVSGSGKHLAITIAADGTLAGFFENDGQIIVDTGDSLSINAVAGETFAGAGTVSLLGGSALINATFAGFSGQDNFNISQSGSLEIQQSGTSSQAHILFNGPGTLKLDQPGSFAGTIDGFALGDTIDLGVLNVTSVVYDDSGNVSYLGNGGSVVFAAHANSGVFGGNGSGTFALGGAGGVAGDVIVTQGGGGDTVLTAAGPRTWMWNGTSASAETPGAWTLIAGPPGGFGGPGAGDTAIIDAGTVLGGGQFNLTANTIELGGTAGLAAILTDGGGGGGGNQPASAQFPSLDDSSIITNAVPGNNTAESSLLATSGMFVNEGYIVANGPAGSSFTITVGTSISNGTPQPGYFINYNDIEVDAGNTMTITVSADSELFNDGVIQANGGTLVINAAPGAIVGGYAPTSGVLVIAGGGMVDTNASYPATLPGSSATVGGIIPTYAFADATAGNTLKIENIGSFGGVIIGFGQGDTIDVGASLAVGKVAYSSSTGILALEDAGGTILASLLLGSGNFQNGTTTVAGGGAGSFTIGTGADGDTVITTPVQNDYFNNTSGSWQSAGLWSNGVPGTLDTALIGIGSNSPFTLTTGGTPVSVGALTVASDHSTLQITSNTTAAPYISYDFGGTIEVTSGNTLTTPEIRMEGGLVQVDPTAVVNLTGRQNPQGVGANNGTLAIANGNTAAFRVNAGTLMVNGGTMNAAPGVAGGGGNFFIGYNGGGTPGVVAVQNNGANAGVVSDSYAIVSSDPTSFGVLTLNGNARWTDTIDPTDTVTTRGYMIVGFNNQSGNSGTLTPAPISGAATLVVENGATLTEQSYAIIADGPNSAGSVLVANALWNIGTGATGGFLDVGQLGNGVVRVDGGGVVNVGHGGTFVNNGTSFTGSGINIGQSITGAGTLTVQNGGIVNDAAGVTVGAAGHGLLQVLNGGTINLTGTNGITLGNLAGSVGTLIVSGQSNAAAALVNFTSTAKGFTVGGAGQGTLDIESGGTIQLNGTGGIGVGTSAGALGLMIVNGPNALINGGAAASGIGIGQAGTGTLEVENGGQVILHGTAANSGIGIGQTAGANGLVLVTGANSKIDVEGPSGINVGPAGNGTLEVLSGGSVFINTNGLGIGSAGTGVVVVSGLGSSLSTHGGIGDGTGGDGSMTVSAGASVSSELGMNVGINLASKGSLLVDAASLTVGNLKIGAGGTGTATITNGGVVNTTGANGIGVNVGAASTLVIGGGVAFFGGTGSLTINGGTLNDNGQPLSIGTANAKGTLLVEGGGSLISGGTSAFAFANINATGTGSAAVTVSSGTWTSNGSIIVGDTGTGSLDINSNGQVNAFQNSVAVGNQSTGKGTLSLETGGTLLAGSVSIADGHDSTSRGTVTIGANSLLQAGNFSDNGGGTVDVNGASARLVSVSGISVGSSAGGTGLLSVEAGGAVSANGANLSIGGGNTSNGTVTVGLSGSLTAAAGISLAGGTGSTGVLSVNGGNVSETGIFSIGKGSGGTVAVSGGGTIVANAGTGIASMSVGGGTMSLLSINNAGVSVNGMGLNVGGLNALGSVTVGASGTLSNNNTNSTAVFISATGTGAAAATVSGAGALWKSNGQFVVGDTGGGSLDINTNGVVNAATASFTIGQQSGGSGTVSLESGGSLRAATLTMDGAAGLDATATLTMTGGAVLVNTLIENAGGVITLSGGAISVSGAATIGQGGTGASVTQTGGNITAGAVTVAQNAGSSGTIAVTGGTFAASGLFEVGGQGSGAVTIGAGGSLIAGNGIQINGNGASGSGALVVNGGAVTETGQVALGTGGSAQLIVEAGGSFIVNGTSNSVTQLSIGSLAGGMAALIVDNGLVNLGNGVLSIGAGGNGSLLIENGGTVTSTHNAAGPSVDINANSGAQASAQVVGVGSVWDLTSSGAQFVIGDNGNGSLSVSAGGVVNAGTNVVDIGNVGGGAGTVSVTSGGTFIASSSTAIILGAASGSSGTMTVSGPGSKVIATGQLDLGSNGAGSLSISNQATVQSGNGSLGVVLGQAGSAFGEVNVSGAKSLLINAGQFVVGDNGLGSLSISAGGTVITSPGTAAVGLVIGNSSGAAGSSVNVSGAGSNLQVTGLLDVGVNGSGSLQLSGGAGVTAGALDAGNSSTSVAQISVTGAGTNLTVLGDATVADDGTGVLSVLDGASFSATNLTIGSQGNSSGALVVSGAGSVINLTGSLNIGTALGVGDLTIGPGGAVHAAVVNLQGQVVLEGGNLDPTVTIINQGQTAGGNGTIQAGFIVDEGVVQAGGTKPSQKLLIVDGTVVGGGTLTVNGTVQGSSPAGILQINAGGTLELTGPVLNAATTTFTDNLAQPGTYTINNSVIDVTFADSAGVLQLDDIAHFAGTISSYVPGDSWVITGGTITDLSVVNNHTLVITDTGVNAGPGGFDQLIFAAPITMGIGVHPSWGIRNGNTIVAAVFCVAEGTRITTANGPVPVEELAVGDLVINKDGLREPVVWVGSRAVNCTAHPAPEKVWPVRVMAGAFGPGRPARDLWLSPDHAVFVNNALVPVKLLINGTSIAQVERASVTYYHVELPRHDVILAEGLTVESYLDIGDRSDFRGDVSRLFPDFGARLAPDIAHVWETRGAARLVMAGPELDAAKRGIAEMSMVQDRSRRSA